MVRTYSEMAALSTFDERFEYLKLGGIVGDATFGFSRYLNQMFYTSYKWKKTRRQVIIRDSGCDLGCEDRPIYEGLFIHHLNPITLAQVEDDDWRLYDLENLVCCSYDTHLAIHYGSDSLLPYTDFARRSPNDTIPWR